MHRRDHLRPSVITADDAIRQRRCAHQEAVEERRREARRLVDQALTASHACDESSRRFEPHPIAKLFCIYRQIRDAKEVTFEDPDLWRIRPRPDGARSFLLILPTGWVWVAKSGKVLKSVKRHHAAGLDLNLFPTGTILDGVYRVEETGRVNYFLLDVLVWHHQDFAQCGMEMREFFLKSRFVELQLEAREDMSDCSQKRGRIAFCLISSAPMTTDMMQLMIDWSVQANNQPETSLPDLSTVEPPACSATFRVDGLLLSHSEAEYLPGPTPFICHWRLPATTTWQLSDGRKVNATLSWARGEAYPRTSDNIPVMMKDDSLPAPLLCDLQNNPTTTLIRICVARRKIKRDKDAIEIEKPYTVRNWHPRSESRAGWKWSQFADVSAVLLS